MIPPLPLDAQGGIQGGLDSTRHSGGSRRFSGRNVHLEGQKGMGRLVN